MVTEDVLEALSAISTATAAMVLLKNGIRNAAMRGVRPFCPPGVRICGSAYTLRYVPAREDLAPPAVLGDPAYPARVAVESAPPGSVLVIDARRDGETGMIGDLLAERLRVRGVAGVVTDGGVRDGDDVAAVGLPVFCAGAAAPASITRLIAVDAETTIGCGGVAVAPGDVILGDGDGVVVVPAHLAAAVAEAGPAQERYERFAREKIGEGRAVPGLYPPNDATRAEYARWREDGDEDAG